MGGRTPGALVRLDAKQREYFKLVHEKGMTQGAAWKLVNPGKTWKSVASLRAAAAEAMDRCIDRINIDDYLRSRGLDDDALAKILVDASRAKKIVVNGDGVVFVTKDHAMRMRAFDRAVELRYGRVVGGDGDEQNRAGGENHLHIHLPAKSKSDEEWQAENLPILQRLDRTGSPQSDS